MLEFVIEISSRIARKGLNPKRYTYTLFPILLDYAKLCLLNVPLLSSFSFHDVFTIAAGVRRCEQCR